VNQTDKSTNNSGFAKQRKVQINVPSHYQEIKPEIWQDLESYLFDGFLVSPSNIFGENFVFKTLNHLEVKQILWKRSIKGAAPEVDLQFRSAFIANSIFLLNGENMLIDRHKNLSKLMKLVSKLSPKIQDKIVENISYINKKASRLHPLVEVYAYENRSRYKWLQISHMPIHADECTGIAGTSNIGMNHCQSAWVALNKMIDKREQSDIEWSYAKFIGSCWNSKGVRQADEQDRARKAREQQERDDLKFNLLMKYMKNQDLESNTQEGKIVTLPDGRQALVSKRFMAESVEELADQLSASLSGEKDYHDLVIEQKRKEYQDKLQAIEIAKQRMWEESMRRPLPVAGSGTRILGGKKEADAYMKKMNEERFKRLKINLGPGDDDATIDAHTYMRRNSDVDKMD
jgi:hypothetical protein